jgi:hypothetical protein
MKQPPHFHLDHSRTEDWHVVSTDEDGKETTVLVRKYDCLQALTPDGGYEPYFYLVSAREASIAVKLVTGTRPDYIISRETYGVVFK